MDAKTLTSLVLVGTVMFNLILVYFGLPHEIQCKIAQIRQVMAANAFNATHDF